jgi:hypothetical protein
MEKTSISTQKLNYFKSKKSIGSCIVDVVVMGGKSLKSNKEQIFKNARTFLLHVFGG